MERKQHMEVRRTVIREVRRVLYISAATAAVTLSVFAILGQLTFSIAGGIVSGLMCGTANFCLLAATVLRIGTAENAESSTAKRIMTRSYVLRMAFMAVFSIAAINFLKVNPLIHAMMLVLPGFAARIRRR